GRRRRRQETMAEEEQGRWNGHIIEAWDVSEVAVTWRDTWAYAYPHPLSVGPTAYYPLNNHPLGPLPPLPPYPVTPPAPPPPTVPKPAAAKQPKHTTLPHTALLTYCDHCGRNLVGERVPAMRETVLRCPLSGEVRQHIADWDLVTWPDTPRQKV